MRKGIILAGGLGTRLFPLTSAISKQILPVYDKPMIYYPLSNLIMSGIREILIISSPVHIKFFEKLLGNGKSLGLKIKYTIQKKPNGIAEALILSQKFLNGSDMCLILGDNIFFGGKIKKKLIDACNSKNQSIFIKHVKTPEKYGVLKFVNSKATKIIEKPKKFLSNYAITGIYFYNNNSINIAKKIKPSKRNEIEISELNQILLSRNNLDVVKLGKNTFWYDAGDHNEYLKTSIAIRNYEKNHNTILGSIEYESIKNNFLSKTKFKKNIIKDNFYYKKVLKNLK